MDFHCSLIPVPVSPRDNGILNGDTKATLVAWGDDITFLDRDEDNGRHRRIPRHFEHRASNRLKRASSAPHLRFHSQSIPFLFLRLLLLFYFSARRGEENLRLQWRDLQNTMIGTHTVIGVYFKTISSLKPY